MQRHRYMIVEHPVANEKIEPHKRFEDFMLPIHTLLGTYHWVRLDDTHVFVTGYYEINNQAALHAHPKTSVLPPVGSGKTLKNHLLQKVTHLTCLCSVLSLNDSSTTSDVAEAAESLFGTIFGVNQ